MRASWLVGVALAVASCGGGAKGAVTTGERAGAATPAPGGDFEVTVLRQTRGIPHNGMIDFVAVASDASAAITLDHLGAARLWPALDGGAEPIAIPVRGGVSLSVERRGEGHTAAVVDSARSLYIYTTRASAGGGFELDERHASGPRLGAHQVHVLPGGERVLLLDHDGTLSILDLDGTVVSQLSERRFAPEVFAVSADGSSIVVATMTGTGAETSASLRFVSQVDGALRLDDRAHALSQPLSQVGTRVAIGPGGEWAALFVRNDPHPLATKSLVPPVPPPISPIPVRSSVLAVHRDGDQREVQLPIGDVEVKGLGFVSAHEVIATSRTTGQSWRVDLSQSPGLVRGEATPTGNDTQRAPQAFAAGHHVQGDGGWLQIRDVARGTTRYLGYQPFHPSSVSLSPGGQRVAWSMGGAWILIEELDTGRTLRLEAPPRSNVLATAFVDEEHLLVAEQAGALRVVRIDSGEALAVADATGHISALDFDARRGLARIVRGPAGVGALLFEVTLGEISGPYVVYDGATRGGLLREPYAVYSIDPMNELRTYTLEEIKTGIDARAITDRGWASQPPGPMALAVHPDGRLYQWKQVGAEAVLQLVDPKADGEHRSFELPSRPQAIVASPDGRRFLSLSGDGNLSVVDVATGQALFTRSIGGISAAPVWAADGRSIAVSTFAGGAVYSASSGDVLRASCGPIFELRDTPPPVSFSGSQEVSLCER